jgi:branched-chain amino acid aminotransferase
MDSRYNLISFNKEYISTKEFSLNLSNRAFRYGDGFFETMHANGLDVQFINDHFSRIEKAAKILKIELPEYFTLNFLKIQVAGLLRRNKLFQGVRIKLTIYRNGEGFYIPKSNKAEVVIEAHYLSKGAYELNEKGITVGIYNEIPKPICLVSSFKSINAQLYVLAGIYSQQNGFDDALLINDKGFLVEATSSNIFALKDKTLYTPSLDSGCVEGVMRKQVIRLASGMGFNVNDKADILPGDLIEMDELFLTNAIVGLKYVSGYKTRRYFKKASTKIISELNKLL